MVPRFSTVYKFYASRDGLRFLMDSAFKVLGYFCAAYEYAGKEDIGKGY